MAHVLWKKGERGIHRTFPHFPASRTWCAWGFSFQKMLREGGLGQNPHECSFLEIHMTSAQRTGIPNGVSKSAPKPGPHCLQIKSCFWLTGPCPLPQASTDPPRALSPGYLSRASQLQTSLLLFSTRNTEHTELRQNSSLRSPVLLEEGNHSVTPRQPLPVAIQCLQSWWILRSPNLWHSTDPHALWDQKVKEMNLLSGWQYHWDDSSFLGLRSLCLAFALQMSVSWLRA